MTKTNALGLIALSGFLLLGCQKPAAPPPPPTPAVSVAVPLREGVLDWDDFSGRFEAPERVEVRARVGGFLQGAHFREGDFVRKGQLLFTLDPRTAQAQLASARAQAEVARADARRAETLLSAQAVSREEFENRRAAMLVADAALRARELDVEFTRVTAPISGVISERRVDPGNVISGGQSGGDVLATVVSVDPIHFIFDASEAQILRYQREAGGQRGRAVQIRLQDETEPRWSGSVDFADSTLDPNSGTGRLRAVIRNPGGFLKPGMFGSARMAGSKADEGLLIPETAIVADGPRKVAYVVAASGEVQARPLELGPLTGGMRVVRQGLRPDERVIVNGVQRVRPGQKAQAKLVTVTRSGGGAPVAQPSVAASPTTATAAR